MPPTVPSLLPSIKHVIPVSNALSRLSRRAAADALTPLASVFALVIRDPSAIHTRSLTVRRSDGGDDAPLDRREVYVLAIPTTYAGLDAGPSPGIVVAIMLGSIVGFVGVWFGFLLLVRLYSGPLFFEQKEEVVVRRRHSSHRSASTPPPPRRRRTSRVAEMRATTTTTTERRRSRVVKETVRPPPPPPSEPTELTVEEEVIVEEEPEEIVEVIEEEESPTREERKESRRVSRQAKREKRSGFRTVDPAEFGGGAAPRRSLGRL